MNEIKKLMLNQSIQTNIEAIASMRGVYDEKQKLRFKKIEERYKKIETKDCDLIFNFIAISLAESINQHLEYTDETIDRLERENE